MGPSTPRSLKKPLSLSYSACASGVVKPLDALRRARGAARYKPLSGPSTNPFQPIFFRKGNFS